MARNNYERGRGTGFTAQNERRIYDRSKFGQWVDGQDVAADKTVTIGGTKYETGGQQDIQT